MKKVYLLFNHIYTMRLLLAKSLLINCLFIFCISASAQSNSFQLFFTTKPTGQGTGLGLSMSYDIIKAHGGEIKVDTKKGEGTEFIIQLMIS